MDPPPLTPHFGMCATGFGISSSVKMGVSGINIGHSGTDFIGIRGVSGTRYCEKNGHALPMDGRLAGTVWLAAGGDERLKRKEILKTMVSGTAKMQNLPGN